MNGLQLHMKVLSTKEVNVEFRCVTDLLLRFQQLEIELHLAIR